VLVDVGEGEDGLVFRKQEPIPVELPQAAEKAES
jgi:hypothetical protein